MSEKKIKPKFNIIDVLIILLLAAVLWVFAGYATAMDGTVRYTVEVKGIREENVGAYAPGDEIVGEKGEVVVKIVSVGEYTNETAAIEDESINEYVISEIPNKYTVKMVLEAPYEEKEQGKVVGGMYTIKVGKRFNIKTDKYVTASTILEVEEG